MPARRTFSERYQTPSPFSWSICGRFYARPPKPRSTQVMRYMGYILRPPSLGQAWRRGRGGERDRATITAQRQLHLSAPWRMVELEVTNSSSTAHSTRPRIHARVWPTSIQSQDMDEYVAMEHGRVLEVQDVAPRCTEHQRNQKSNRRRRRPCARSLFSLPLSCRGG